MPGSTGLNIPSSQLEHHTDTAYGNGSAIAHATNESWRYNAAFLQGVSGVELKSHHTQEFMAGYINGTQIYWNNRGYAEGNNRLPMSSQNVNYTSGYRDATDDLAKFGNLGAIPSHPRDFYLGLYQGGIAAGNDHDSCPAGGPCYDKCPSGHTQHPGNNTKLVMESSGMWYNIYECLSKRHLDVRLSNPAKTRAITSAKIKTDKLDAVTLADLLRGGYIAECYIPTCLSATV
jgi:hypothetical protein